MAITITTINNSSAVAKTFTEIGKDRQNAEWLNTTDAAANRDDRINIKQSFLGTKTKLGSRIRRSLVQYRLVVPTATAGVSEELIVNVTFTCPETRTVVTDTHVVDAMAFLRNLITDTNVPKIVRGEV